MGKSIPIRIGEFSYPTKTAARDAVRELIGKYSFNEKLNNDDKLYCMELFKRHSEHKNKIGCGIKYIEVKRDEYGHKYFHLFRIDGTDEDISWVHCISPKKNKD